MRSDTSPRTWGVVATYLHNLKNSKTMAKNKNIQLYILHKWCITASSIVVTCFCTDSAATGRVLDFVLVECKLNHHIATAVVSRKTEPAANCKPN